MTDILIAVYVPADIVTASQLHGNKEVVDLEFLEQTKLQPEQPQNLSTEPTFICLPSSR